MSARPILLDTCALIWVVQSAPVRAEALEALDEADQVLVSPISAWEIGQLVSRGRLGLTVDPLKWFDDALEAGLQLAGMPPTVLVASSYLPHSALRDPADKILAATARAHGYRLMTRDRPLLDYAEAGHLQAISC